MKISPGVQTEVGDKIQHFVLVILPLYCNIYFCGNFGQAKASIAKKKKKKKVLSIYMSRTENKCYYFKHGIRKLLFYLLFICILLRILRKHVPLTA